VKEAANNLCTFTTTGQKAWKKRLQQFYFLFDLNLVVRTLDITGILEAPSFIGHMLQVAQLRQKGASS